MKPRWIREFTPQTGQPRIPDIWRGYVYVGGKIAPAGLAVQAVINGYSRCDRVTDANGRYYLDVPEEGIHDDDMGATVEFWVNQVRCGETGTIDGTRFATEHGGLDLHVGESAIPTSAPELAMAINQARVHAQALVQALEAIEAQAVGLEEAVSPFYPPYKVYDKLWPGSVHYLGELITPYAAAVQDKAAAIRDKTGEELIKATFLCVHEQAIKYAYDVSVHGFDHWSPPSITLARGIGDCEDKANLFVSLMIAAGWPRDGVYAGGWEINNTGHEWAVVKMDRWYVIECTANEWHGLMTYEDFRDQLGLEYIETVRFNDRMVEGRDS